MRPQVDTVEQTVARIAGAQHGVVTRAQLLDAGVSAAGIQRRVRKGLLLPVHRGVYRVGHRAPSVAASYLAAVLACGEDAELSGRAAAYLLKVLKGRAPRPEVTAPSARSVPGIKTRRSVVHPSEATVFRGIPVTTVARTLVDLAAILSPDALARACHEAGVLHRTTPRQVDAVLARQPNVRGAAKLRAVLRGDVHVTQSRLEQRFLQHLRDDRRVLPRTNKPAGTKRVDCRWPEYRLTVELDSYRFHKSRHAWEQDRRREREAYARGDEFRRYTPHDVIEDPRQMLREIGELIPQVDQPAARASSGSAPSWR